MVDVLDFILTDRARLRAAAGEQAGDGLGQLLAHLRSGGAHVLQGLAELALVDRRQAAQQKAIAHCANDAVVGVDDAGCAEQQRDFPLHASVRPPSMPRWRVQAPS